MKGHRFHIEGFAEVEEGLIPKEAIDGETVGFTNAKGETARMVMALEVEDENGNCKYLTSEKEMREFGIELMDYHETNFIPEE